MSYIPKILNFCNYSPLGDWQGQRGRVVTFLRNILLCTFFLSFASCGKEAPKKESMRFYFPKSPLTSEKKVDTSSFDSNIRSLTLLIFPLEQDVENFQHHPHDNAIDSWNMFLNSLSYGNKISSSYTADMAPDMKVLQIVTTTFALSESRNEAFRKMKPLQDKMTQLSADIKEKNQGLKDRLSSFMCFYNKDKHEELPYQCHLDRKEEGTWKKKKLRSCRKINEFQFIFASSEQERKAELENIINDCFLLNEQRAQLKVMSDQVKEYETLQESGESVVLDLFQSLESQSEGKNLSLLVSDKRKS